MTERRETGRSHPAKPGSRPQKTRLGAVKNTPNTSPDKARKSSGHSSRTLAEPDWSEGERIAKYLARAGVASRREVERMIEAGDVVVDGVKLTSPAFKVTGRETIKVGRKVISAPEPTRLWRYHKPSGLISTNHDPEGRRTIFDEFPKSLPRIVTVGRLDLTTEGLLLLTNDGELARALELPKNALERTYRVRAQGTVTDYKIADLAAGMTVDGVDYAPITAVFDRENGANSWLTVTLTEGKKREVRRALEAVNLMVNRLIRINYGPFELGDLRPGAVEEVPAELMLETVGTMIADANKPLGEAPKRPAPAAKSRLGTRPGSTRLADRKRRPKK
ncbi:MAG: rRNA pseudouridine synthase [Alphaproteobacteria bacterium]|jgi:23S rRNA pseudouridine2605 synthase|nr:rRNA pseudouridine synthase [Alphaproteobacteria bacterium]